MKTSTESGYTIVELLVCIAGIGILGLIGGGLYVVGHFIAKFW